MHLENQVGLATVTLDLRVVDTDADLAYEQADGFFQTMDTEYRVEAVGDGASEVTATTDFALDVALVGQILHATAIKRQRRHALEQQFDWLQDELAE
jgi:ribosome-associated toxin RatA of RatAB toxin-antitoxin module